MDEISSKALIFQSQMRDIKPANVNVEVDRPPLGALVF